MRFITWIVFLIVVATPIFANRPQQSSFRCRGRSDGYYVDVESGCKKYYVCENNGRRKHTFSCGPGTLFNQDLLVCDHAYNVECGADEVHEETEAANIHEQTYSGIDSRRINVRNQPPQQLAPTNPPPTPSRNPYANYRPSYTRPTEPTTTTTTSTTLTPGTYFDQSPFVYEERYGPSPANSPPHTDDRDNSRNTGGHHSHKDTYWGRDSAAPFGTVDANSASSSTSSLSHNSPTFRNQPQSPIVSGSEQVTAEPQTQEQNVTSTSNSTRPMNMIESMVNWLVNGNESEESANSTTIAKNITESDQPETQQIGMISHPRGLNQQRQPSFRQGSPSEANQRNSAAVNTRDERWNFDEFEQGSTIPANGNSGNHRSLNPVYRPPYDNYDGHVHSRDDDSLASSSMPDNVRRLYRDYEPQVRDNLRTQNVGGESDKHANPWLFPDGTNNNNDEEAVQLKPANVAESQRSQQHLQAAQLQQRKQPASGAQTSTDSTGSAFDFEMGERPSPADRPQSPSNVASRAPRRPPTLEEQMDARADYTSAQIVRAPYGVFDRNGNCRCPSQDIHQYL